MLFENNVRNKNIIISLLEILNVKYTLSYAHRIYNEHPHKHNMYGLSCILNEYGIENAGVQIEDKRQDISTLPIPFIAFAGNNFVTVKEVTKDRVSLAGTNNDDNVPLDIFITMWSGMALIAEKTDKSIEKNYKENRKQEFIGLFQKFILGFALLIVFAAVFLYNRLYESLGTVLILILNCAGICITYLLVKKQLHVQSNYADKICSMFKKSDCNSVLEGNASKLWGIFGWSEIGFSYFISNSFLILLFPQLIPYLAIINIFALPYSIWSIWYQKYKAKQWCPLCLVVQGLFWALFLANFSFGFIDIPILTSSSILIIFCAYLIPFLIINLILPKVSESEQIEDIRQEINSIKASDEIFSILLKQQPYFSINRDVSKVLFGNPSAKNTITILSNPHCNPCAKLHEQIDKLLNNIQDKICVQYILISFEGMEASTQHLISCYQNSESIKHSQKIFSEWYKNGKYNKEIFVNKYNYDINNDSINNEYNSHEAWSKLNNMFTTPVIFFNGYRLPDNYKIEDMIYFTDLDVGL